ncbi:DnaA ATPase domain-containing protein [Desulfosporosinus sp. SB140]|uniref:DnaA/Hda family protein n=1 Tax=Desulfosporosinus paludis TaxID=3115649 RepID=UPI00388D1B18
MDWFLSDFNIKAWRLVKRYRMGKAPSMILIYGPPGVGKSSLLNYLGQQWQKDGRIMTDAASFSRQYAYASQEGKLTQFRQRYRTTPLLLMDDLQYLTGKKQTIEELHYTYEYILLNGGKMIATLETDLLNLNFLGDRLASRFLSGIVMPLSQPQNHEIERFVAEYSRELKLFMDHSIPEIIAQRTENLTEAKKAIHQFIEFAERHNDELSLQCFLSYWQEKARTQHKIINPMNILYATAQTMNLPIEELLGSTQKATVNEARQLAIYTIRTLCNISYPAIASYFNRRHSSILMSYKKMQEKLAQDQELYKRYQEIAGIFKDSEKE